MPATAVVGANWGDEGKGSVTDRQVADLYLRYQGGNNAGHTVRNPFGRFALHMIPSGVFSGKPAIIGTGTVPRPKDLVAELQELNAAGVATNNVILSERAHLVMPYHVLLDNLTEAGGVGAVGSTRKGIAYAYADKALRRGFQAHELRDLSAFEGKLREYLPWINNQITFYEHQGLSVDDVMAEIVPAAKVLVPMIRDTLSITSDALARGLAILLEGQLGVMKDLDWGTYRYVTSSSPIDMSHASGVPVRAIDRIIGVVKAFSTAVGDGPFVTEVHGDICTFLRESGPEPEYGATSGRPRRCGWLDLPVLVYAHSLVGFTELYVTKLDVLSGLDEIPVCTGYRRNDRVSRTIDSVGDVYEAEPVYMTMRGWSEDISNVRHKFDLPLAAVQYVNLIEDVSGVRVATVSVGPHRDAVIPWR